MRQAGPSLTRRPRRTHLGGSAMDVLNWLIMNWYGVLYLLRITVGRIYS